MGGLRWAGGAVALAAGAVAVTAAVVDEPATATAEPAAYADYNDGRRLVGEPPTLCIEDHTGGFPVREAAWAYDGIIEMVIEPDCADYVNAVQVVTVISEDQLHAGWYDPPAKERDYQGLIKLDVGEAYRMDPRAWRLVLIHELGHAVGLQHTNEAVSLMNGRYTLEFDDLTPADLEQLREIYP
jgi:hypothetical protein